MATSYERINYNLRPAKSIERKLLCEAFRRLSFFADPNEYRYIGFGSTFFSDFILFHKSLGLSDMLSVEKEEKDKKRFIFNQPYSCIKLVFGDTNDVLPNLRWTKKIILWLDYDYKLDNDMLTDIGTFISRAKTRSIILLTMDVAADELPSDENQEKRKKGRYEQLLERIEKSKIPLEITEKDLDTENYPKVCYKIVNNEIEDALSKRNGGLENKLIYKQLFNFHYKDGSSPMLTLGGILYADTDLDTIGKCKFEKLNFLRCDKTKYDPYKIFVPQLTFREMRYLDQVLHLNKISKLRKKDKVTSLPKETIMEYSKIYRYFPNFVEAEMH